MRATQCCEPKPKTGNETMSTKTTTLFVAHTDAPTIKDLMGFAPAGHGECMWAVGIAETLDGWFVTYPY
jgi:hypothetical protein